MPRVSWQFNVQRDHNDERWDRLVRVYLKLFDGIQPGRDCLCWTSSWASWSASRPRSLETGAPAMRGRTERSWIWSGNPGCLARESVKELIVPTPWWRDYWYVWSFCKKLIIVPSTGLISDCYSSVVRSPNWPVRISRVLFPPGAGIFYFSFQLSLIWI